MVHFIVRAAVCIPFFGASGCVLPYAYPRVDMTRAVSINAPVHEVHAFRVDGVEKDARELMMGSRTERLTPIELSGMSNTPELFKTSLTHGYYQVPLIGIPGPREQRSTLSIRLYRRGYELVELLPGQKVESVSWTKVKGRDGLAEAIAKAFPVKSVETGVTSEGHYRALLFGVAEYEHLAGIVDSAVERDLLLEQAERLRRVATLPTRRDLNRPPNSRSEDLPTRDSQGELDRSTTE